MKPSININTGQPLRFIHYLDSEYTVTDVLLPTFIDVIDLPEGLAMCLAEQPLKRWDLCLPTYPSFL